MTVWKKIDCLIQAKLAYMNEPLAARVFAGFKRSRRIECSDALKEKDKLNKELLLSRFRHGIREELQGRWWRNGLEEWVRWLPTSRVTRTPYATAPATFAEQYRRHSGEQNLEVFLSDIANCRLLASSLASPAPPEVR